MSFDLDKKNILGKIDKSKKGEIDEGIQEIVDIINSKENYYTTSSCSGRIVLIEIPESGRKDESKWLLATHNKTSLNEVKSSLRSEKDVWLKAEGMILHVCCKTIKDAENLVNLAKNTGFKRTGMITVNKRYIVEIVSTENVSTIVMKKGKLLVDDSYLSALIDECNAKMDKNNAKLKEFHKKLITF
ncbi:MAG: tRNA wybutosine-synthesizing 3 family protein [Candidatus Woesearchaeota archaeon]